MRPSKKISHPATILILGAMLSSTAPASGAAKAAEVIKLGVLPVNQPQTIAKRFAPLIAYLKRETGHGFELRLYPTGSKSGGYTAAVKGLLKGSTPH